MSMKCTQRLTKGEKKELRAKWERKKKLLELLSEQTESDCHCDYVRMTIYKKALNS